MLMIVVLASLLATCLADAPEVQIYTYKPAKDGELNVLLCHAKRFSPPNIKLQLLEDGKIMSEAKQTDLSFESDWSFKLTTFVDFVPKSGMKYTCKVEHGSASRDLQWDMNGY
ncbi:beta-2-microglobulin-like [Heptranchias perlo]|uniref:beta-2-microglobulin-like n=1 Tax=Heptranchias perlo TaxID=212740 RepID=UPI00355AA334